jgi:hypothetical protein
MSVRRHLFLMPLALLVVTLSSAGLRLAEAGLEERVFQNQEIVAADLAPAGFGKFRVVAGRVTLRADGYGSGAVTYGVKGQRPVARIRLDWRERGRVPLERGHEPGGTGVGVWWSPTHQVRVTVEDLDSQDGLETGALMQLARSATVNLRARALPWPPTILALELARDIPPYRLAGVMVMDRPPENGARTSVTYAIPERAWRDAAERVRHHRLLRFDIDWVVSGMDPRRAHVPWEPDDRSTRPARLGESPMESMWSPTHLARIELRGEYYDERRQRKQAFVDAAHLARGREIATLLMRRIETLAQPRGAALRPTNTPHVADRPAAVPDTGRSTGTITSATGRFMLIRGGRRVNVEAGGRVQMGDTIITSASGSVVIRFDDPTAGGGQTGQLAIARGTKVTIDVPPVRPGNAPAAVRIGLSEGGVRVVRPHHPGNPLVELRLPGDGGLFGLEGTDVVAVPFEGNYIVSVREGRVAQRVGGRIVALLPAGTSSKISPTGEMLLQVPVSEEQYAAGNETFGIPAIAAVGSDPDRSGWQLVPRPGDAFLDEYSADDLQALLVAFQEADQRAQQAYASFMRRLPSLSEGDAEIDNWDTIDYVEDALDAYDDLRMAFPVAVNESSRHLLKRHRPDVHKAWVRLRAYREALFDL